MSMSSSTSTIIVDPPIVLQIANEYQLAVLRYSPVKQWACIERFSDKHKDSETIGGNALVRLLLADFYANMGRPHEAVKLIKLVAKQPIKSLSPRAQSYLAAMQLWLIDHRLHDAFLQFRDRFASAHDDLLACKRAQLMGLFGGFNAEILDAAQAAQPPPIDTPYFLGMLAFGHEQAGQYKLAEKTARQGLAVCEAKGVVDGWLQHALAHALFFQGPERLDEGIAFLQASSSSWSLETMMPFLFTHLWWHLALLYVNAKDYKTALHLFDTVLWEPQHPALKDDVQVQINALELLWRMQQVPAMRSKLHVYWHAVWVAFARHPDMRDTLLHVLGVGAICLGTFEKTDRVKLLEQHIEGAVCVPAMRRIMGLMGNILGVEVRVSAAESSAKGSRAKWGAVLGVNKAEAKLLLRDMEGEWSCVGGSTEQRQVLFQSALEM